MSAFGPGTIIVQALGWCLVHFVWQAALVGALYAIVRSVLPRGHTRYLAAMAAMILLAILPILTGWHEFRVLAEQPVELGPVFVTGASGLASPMAAVAAPRGWLATLRTALPWLVLAWGCGVLFLAVRVVRQWRCLRAIVRAAETLSAWQERAQSLGQRLGLRLAVRVLASARIATPTLVGWLRPVVVVPLAMFARMPAEQVDLILVHELAHLRRLDHLANLFQVIVETLLFYHPVVHWISREARNERELCCDALALQATGGRRRDFVAALSGLAEFRARHANLVLAASGGILAERAWFIAGAPLQHRHAHAGMMTIGLALLGIAIALGVAWRQDDARNRIDRVLAANAVVLRHALGNVFADFPTPALREVPVRRPEIAPVPLAWATPPAPRQTSAGTHVAIAPAAVPMLAIANVRVTPMLVPPAILDGSPTASLGVPRAIRTVRPVYPERALLDGLQGHVEVEFSLDPDGVPRGLRVVGASASSVFDAAALLALSRWRFTPIAASGRRYRQIFTFRLGNGAGAVDAAAVQGCIPATGTHICRHAIDIDPGTRVLRSTH